MKPKHYNVYERDCSQHGKSFMAYSAFDRADKYGRGEGCGKALGDCMTSGRAYYTENEIYYGGCDHHGYGYGRGHPSGNCYTNGNGIQWPDDTTT